MSVLYFIALCAVGAAVLAVMAEAVRSVSRKPVWALNPLRPGLPLDELRQTPLAYVGRERRAMAASIRAADAARSTATAEGRKRA